MTGMTGMGRGMLEMAIPAMCSVTTHSPLKNTGINVSSENNTMVSVEDNLGDGQGSRELSPSEPP